MNIQLVLKKMHVLDFYILQTYSMSLFIFLKHEPATIISDDEQMTYFIPCVHMETCITQIH